MGTYFSLRPRGHTIKTYYGQSSKYRRFFLEINLRKKKWVISWSYNPHNKIIFSHIESTSRSSHPEVFLEKVFWKYIANLQENTHAEVWFQQSCKAKWHGCSPVNLLYIIRAPFLKNTSRRLLLYQQGCWLTLFKVWELF